MVTSCHWFTFKVLCTDSRGRSCDYKFYFVNFVVRKITGKMKICGPKLSLCGLVISVWGIIQLVSFSIAFSLRKTRNDKHIRFLREFVSKKKFPSEMKTERPTCTGLKWHWIFHWFLCAIFGPCVPPWQSFVVLKLPIDLVIHQYPLFHIQLQTLMGLFYYKHSVALVEDLPLEGHYATPKEFFAAADAAYSQVRNNRIIALAHNSWPMFHLSWHAIRNVMSSIWLGSTQRLQPQQFCRFGRNSAQLESTSCEKPLHHISWCKYNRLDGQRPVLISSVPSRLVPRDPAKYCWKFSRHFIWLIISLIQFSECLQLLDSRLYICSHIGRVWSTILRQ